MSWLDWLGYAIAGLAVWLVVALIVGIGFGHCVSRIYDREATPRNIGNERRHP